MRVVFNCHYSGRSAKVNDTDFAKSVQCSFVKKCEVFILALGESISERERRKGKEPID